MRLYVCAISNPGEPDHARGLLELLRYAEPELGFERLGHVHGLSPSEFADGYLADDERRLPGREGERGRADRLNAAVELAAGSGADYALLVESDVWPLKPRLLAAWVRRVSSRAQLLGGAAMGRSGRTEPPAGGLWPRLLVVDLAWQRAKRLFPLDYERYADAVLMRSDQWEVPTLAGCLSASYFRRITEGAPTESAREVALTQLTRLEELEPVLAHGAEQWSWPSLALIRASVTTQRADIVRRVGAGAYGPTLASLETNELNGFNGVRAHPPTGTLARRRRRDIG